MVIHHDVKVWVQVLHDVKVGAALDTQGVNTTVPTHLLPSRFRSLHIVEYVSLRSYRRYIVVEG